MTQGETSSGAAGCCGGGAGRSCADPVADGSPVSLCWHHLALARDWLDDATGVVDVVREPCLACGSVLAVRYASGRLCALCDWRHGDVVDPDLPVPRVDVVYYIRFEGRIKIGTSSNPRQRLARLWHDELLAFEPGDRRVEHARHVQFGDSRLARTEWFDRSPSLDAHVETLRAGQSDPWTAYARWLSAAMAIRA